MYGYIYLTQNTITGDVYVGKHKAPMYNPNYYGSGKTIRSQLATYGRSAFTNTILATANTKDELNQLERQFVRQYKQQYPRQCINIAAGGDGGDTFSGKPSNEKTEFISKMTNINKARCSTPEFKQAAAKRMTDQYKSPAARRSQSEKIRKAWSNPELRIAQSARLKAHFETHKKDQSYLHKSCVMELNGIAITFQSVKALRQYLTDQFHYTPDRRTFHKLMENGKNNIPFKPFHKTKYAALAGMRIYYE